MRKYLLILTLLWVSPSWADSTKVWLTFDPTALGIQELHLGMEWIKPQKPNHVNSLKLVYLGHNGFMNVFRNIQAPVLTEGLILHYETKYLLGTKRCFSPYFSIFEQVGYLHKKDFIYLRGSRHTMQKEWELGFAGMGYKVGFRGDLGKRVCVSSGIGIAYRAFSKNERAGYGYAYGYNNRIEQGTKAHFNLDIQFRIR